MDEMRVALHTSITHFASVLRSHRPRCLDTGDADSLTCLQKRGEQLACGTQTEHIGQPIGLQPCSRLRPCFKCNYVPDKVLPTRSRIVTG